MEEEDIKPQSVRTSTPQWKFLLASSLAGIVARVVTHPMDTFKTISQSQGNPINQIQLSTFHRLYRGLPIACLFHAPALSVYLSTYDYCKNYFGRTFGENSLHHPLVHLSSGVIAEVFSGVFWTPMEVVKQRLQVSAFENTNSFKNSWDVVSSTLKSEGILGLYKGYFLTLCVFVPYSMVYFMMYERLKEWQQKRLGVQSLPFYSFVISSAIAGAVGGGLANPLDVIKTRWQVQTAAVGSEFHQSHPASFQQLYRQKPNLDSKRLYKNPLDIAIRMYKEEGIRSFGKGAIARILWIAPSVAISMPLYEQFKIFLRT